MERRAQTEHEILDVIARRWSSRAVDPERTLNESTLMTLLDAARWAPSSFNEQPWRYLVFDHADPESLGKARACLTEGNAWAKAAPTLLLSVAKESFTKNGKPNRHHLHDTGAASISMALQAASMGLLFHQMAGFDRAKARESFGIPAGFTPVVMIAVGYPLSDDRLDPDLRERYSAPRNRLPIANIASRGSWDSTLM